MSRFSAVLRRGQAAAARAEAEDGATGVGPTTGRAQARKVPLPYVWQPTALGSAARAGKISDVLLNEIVGILGGLPQVLFARLLLLLKASGANNQLWKSAEQDWEDLLKAQLDELGTTEDQLRVEMEATPTWLVTVLAAHLGATQLTGPDTWFSDQTVLESQDETLKHLPPESRNVATLRCYLLSSYALATANQQPMCYCGAAPAFAKGRRWGTGPASPSFFQCATGKCRYWMTIDAQNELASTMSHKNLTFLPLVFCPLHPTMNIKFQLVGKDRQLRAKCAWYSKTEAGGYEGCVCDEVVFTEVLGAYGPVLWKIMSLLK